MTAGIIDFWVTAVVIVVKAIDEMMAMLLTIPRPLMVFVLYVEVATSFLCK